MQVGGRVIAGKQYKRAAGTWSRDLVPFHMQISVQPMPTQPFVLLQQNQEAVKAAILAGTHDAVWESRRNAFDELIAFLVSTGVFALFPLFKTTRQRDGIPDDLMLRVLLTSVFLRCPSIRQIPGLLFTDPGVLRFLGFTIRQVEEGFNARGGEEKHLPFSHETLYDLWPRLTLSSIGDVRDAYTDLLVKKRLIRGETYVIDGSSVIGMGTKQVFLPLLNIRGGRELVVSYRLLEHGKDRHDSELTGAKEMVRAALTAGVKIRKLIVDRAYVDGVWMRELVELGIDLMVRVKEDMHVFTDMLGHGRGLNAPWQERKIMRKIEGRQVEYRVRLLLVRDLETWDSYDGPLTGLLVESTPLEGKNEGETTTMVIVTPQVYTDPWLMWRDWHRRWRVENTGFHEQKEGYLLEKGLWGRSPEAVALSILFRVIAYNTSRLYVSDLGKGWVIRGLRALNREVFDATGMFLIVEAGGEFAILTAKELLYLVGRPPRLQRPPDGYTGASS